jgi:hypothetical protein
LKSNGSQKLGRFVRIFESKIGRRFCQMNEWFGDPFFSGNAGDVQSHFSEMGRMMSTMFNHFRELDRQLGFDEPRRAGPRAIEDHSSPPGPRIEEPSSQSRLPRIHEPTSQSQPSRPAPSGKDAQPHFYVYSAMASVNGRDGIAQARKKSYDSSTGKTEMAEMRRLGDQALAVRREIDRDGKVTEQVDRKNLNENEVESFRQRWDGQRSSLPRLTDGRRGPETFPRALK